MGQVVGNRVGGGSLAVKRWKWSHMRRNSGIPSHQGESPSSQSGDARGTLRNSKHRLLSCPHIFCSFENRFVCKPGLIVSSISTAPVLVSIRLCLVAPCLQAGKSRQGLSSMSWLNFQVVEVPTARVVPANPDLLDCVDNLTGLSHLNEPSILHDLERRYSMDAIYTLAGPVLVAINPLRSVRFLLHQLANHTNDQYKGCFGDDDTPSTSTLCSVSLCILSPDLPDKSAVKAFLPVEYHAAG